MHMRAMLPILTLSVLLMAPLAAEDAHGTAVSITPDAAKNAPVRLTNETRNYVLEADGSYHTHWHSALLVQNKLGLHNAPIRNITFHSASQRIESLSAYTLKADGRKIPVEPSAILERDAPPPTGQNYPLFSDRKQKSIFFSQVQVGDSMVYDIDIAVAAKPGHEFQITQTMSHQIATDAFDITLSTPQSHPLRIGATEFTQTQKDTGDRLIYTLHYANLLPHKEPTRYLEDNSTIPHADISSFRDYDEMAALNARQTNARSPVTPAIQAKAEEITAGISGKRNIAKALHDWVAKNILYLAEEIGEDGYIPHDATAILSHGYGDCKDHAALYMALLKAKGIRAESVLINTKAVYQQPEIPTGNFNHEITYLPEFKLYTDTTASTYAFGTLPMYEYGKQVLHLVENGKALRQIPALTEKDSTFSFRVTAVVKDDGMMTVSTDGKVFGPLTSPLRTLETAQNNTDMLSSAALSGLTGIKDLHYKVSPAQELSPLAEFHSEYQRKLQSPTAIALMPTGFFPLSLTSIRFLGPVADSKNKTFDPVACTAGQGSEDYDLQLPAGIQAMRLPADTTVETPALSYRSHWSQSPGHIRLHRELRAKFRGALCSGLTEHTGVNIDLAKISHDATQSFHLTGPKPQKTDTKTENPEKNKITETPIPPPDGKTSDGGEDSKE